MTISTIKPGMTAALASPHTPIAVINGTPIYALQGGRSGGGIQFAVGDDDGTDPEFDDDADEEDADDDEDDEPDDDTGDEDEDDKPARRKKTGDSDAIARMEAALKKANSEAAKHRRAGKAMQRLGIEDLGTWLTERGIDPETGLPFGDDVVDPREENDEALLDEPEERRNGKTKDRETVRAVRAARAAAERDAREMYVPILAQQAATLALREAGFKGSQAKMEKVLRLIDPNDLDIVLDAGEFEIEGLDEAISAIQDDFPELFGGDDDRSTRRTAAKTTGTGRPRTASRRATGARDVDGGERGKPAPKKGGWMEQLVQQMDKRGR